MSQQKKLIVASLILLLASAVANAEADKAWLADAAGCKFLVRTANPPPQPMTWDGACVDGYVSGPGTVNVGIMTFRGEFKQGMIVSGEVLSAGRGSYKGGIKDNMPHGQGVVHREDGTIVQATFSDGDIVGAAEVTWTNGVRYQGEVLEMTIMHGKGKLTYADGSTYEGEFSQGQHHGKGKLVWTGGGSYLGEFAFGKYQGHGVLVTMNGSIYDGQFASGYKHGPGTLTYPDGSRYVGEFTGDELQGKGRLEFASGLVHEGEWKASKLHGQCNILYPDKSTYVGQCISSEPSGQGRLVNKRDDSIYEGGLVAGKIHGHGRITRPGYVYEGDFASGNRHGQGKEVFDSGEQYEGAFARDQREGQGVLRTPTLESSEIVYNGSFKNGLMHGPGKLTVGTVSFDGEFRQGEFYRGRMRTKDGRIVEVDAESGTALEVKADGSKVPLNPQQPLDPEA